MKFSRYWKSFLPISSGRSKKTTINEKIFDIISKNPESIGIVNKEYLDHNLDVLAAGMDPIHHFARHGVDEERAPHPYYSKDWHAEINNVGNKTFTETILHLAQTRSDDERLKVAFFGYAWNSARRPDPYLRAVIDAIADLGINVDVYIGGQFAREEGTKGLRSDISKSAIENYLRIQNYDFAISFNNSLIFPETVNALSCKIVSIIVDSVHHLFDHTDENLHQAFKLPIHVAPIYSSLIADLANIPDLKSTASFIPPATEIVERNKDSDREQIEISWIASILGDHNLDSFMSRVDHEVPSGLELLYRCLIDIEKIGHISATTSSQEAAKALCEWAHWDYALLEMHLQEVVTNSHRLTVVERLAPLGLKLFGNARWRNVLSLSPSVARAFQSGANLRTHADLCAIYDRSKISINIPQVHAGTGMQYRILDILASRSLLITKYVPNSDMDKLFGKQSPIVTFSDIDDLKAKCEYYLINDAERVARVQACNDLISRGFSFRERVIDYLKLSNEETARNVGKVTGRGSMTLVWPEKVIALDSSNTLESKSEAIEEASEFSRIRQRLFRIGSRPHESA